MCQMEADIPRMTEVTSESESVMVSKSSRVMRGATWYLHALVAAIAVVSVVTRAFSVWVDVRFLGWAGPWVAGIWAISALAAAELAGPGIRGWGRKEARWMGAGHAEKWARRLQWPTFGMVGILIWNMANYFWLVSQGRADWMLPLPGVVAAVLLAWVALTRRWLGRKDPGVDPGTPISRWRQGVALIAAGLTWVFVAGFLLVHCYERPPGRSVDLAVVLGGRVNKNGTASVMLADRVKVAADLYKRGMVQHILLSGGFEPPSKVHPAPRSELDAMRAICLKEGVPPEAISIDPVGVNTKATAFNTRKFMHDNGYRSIVACSTDFHLYRTHMSFAWEGVEAYTIAAQPVEWRCADPYDTLREMVGIVVYLVNPHYREAKGALMELKMPRLVVRKTAGVLELYDGDIKVKEYACITGKSGGDKAQEGDKKTPQGVFHIVYKNPQSQFHLSLGLDYPRADDAQRGLTSGMITRAQYDGIIEALKSDLSIVANQEKLWKTPLGGEIFIHGNAEGRWATAGCVAVKNVDIEELYTILPVGTEVEIRP
jgi:vancomycin permeability regulator SanA